MPTVTVDATWRLSRVELMLPHSGMPQSIMGYGEVLLKEAAGAGPEAAILQRRAPRSDAGDGPMTYGSMPSDTVMRQITPELLADTVGDVGKEVSLSDTLQVLAMFFEKWRVEDVGKPPETVAGAVPPPEPLTPMPPPAMIPEPLPPQDAPGATPA